MSIAIILDAAALDGEPYSAATRGLIERTLERDENFGPLRSILRKSAGGGPAQQRLNRFFVEESGSAPRKHR
jgi:hypothetical protein